MTLKYVKHFKCMVYFSYKLEEWTIYDTFLFFKFKYYHLGIIGGGVMSFLGLKNMLAVSYDVLSSKQIRIAADYWRSKSIFRPAMRPDY